MTDLPSRYPRNRWLRNLRGAPAVSRKEAAILDAALARLYEARRRPQRAPGRTEKRQEGSSTVRQAL